MISTAVNDELLEYANEVIRLINHDLSHPLPIHRNDLSLLLEQKREALEYAIDISMKIIIDRHCYGKK